MNNKTDFAKFEFEEVTCCVCGRKEEHQLYSLKDKYKEGPLEFVKCKNDGLIYQQPAPTKDSLIEFFNSNSFSSQQSTNKAEELTGYFDYLSGEKFRIKMAKERLKLLHSHIPDKKLDILKIAPGTGIFLKLAKEAGHNEMGIDVSKYFVDYAKKKYDINMVHSAFEDFDFNGKKFDVILFFGAIMNVTDPRGFISKIHTLLKPDGHFHVNIISADNWVHKLQKDNFWLIRPPVLNFFNESNFIKLLDSIGYDIVESKTEWQHTHLAKLTNFSKMKWLIGLTKLLKLNSVIVKIPIPGAKHIIAKRKNLG